MGAGSWLLNGFERGRAAVSAGFNLLNGGSADKVFHKVEGAINTVQTGLGHAEKVLQVASKLPPPIGPGAGKILGAIKTGGGYLNAIESGIKHFDHNRPKGLGQVSGAIRGTKGAYDKNRARQKPY
jgi:hypothetical protein